MDLDFSRAWKARLPKSIHLFNSLYGTSVTCLALQIHFFNILNISFILNLKKH